LYQLRQSGAELDTAASYDTQMRPIHWAASDGRMKSLKFLLDHRCDINAQDGNGCSPVIIAAQYGRVEAIVYLVKNGADLNQRDMNGDTALHWAAYKGYEEAAGVLMHFVPQFKDLPDNFGQVTAF
jgi:ankyrin repeat protein